MSIFLIVLAILAAVVVTFVAERSPRCS